MFCIANLNVKFIQLWSQRYVHMYSFSVSWSIRISSDPKWLPSCFQYELENILFFFQFSDITRPVGDVDPSVASSYTVSFCSSSICWSYCSFVLFLHLCCFIPWIISLSDMSILHAFSVYNNKQQIVWHGLTILKNKSLNTLYLNCFLSWVYIKDVDKFLETI